LRGAKFHPEAEAELLAAARFYEGKSKGLGLDFLAEVRQAARGIAARPNSGRKFSRRLRRILVPRFPYGLLYRVEPALVFIVAVAHLHRRPGYWLRRL
jgi:plasmid stabilization system protein ParE